MDAIEDAGLVYVDLTRLRFAEPYSTPVLLELQRRGVEFVADEEPAAQLGTSRVRHPDDPVDVELRIVEGTAATEPEAGWTRLAFVAGLDADETAELAGLEAEQAAAPLAARDEARRGELDMRRQRESVAVLVREVP
jgi:hypothetical protein